MVLGSQRKYEEGSPRLFTILLLLLLTVDINLGFTIRHVVRFCLHHCEAKLKRERQCELLLMCLLGSDTPKLRCTHAIYLVVLLFLDDTGTTQYLVLYLSYCPKVSIGF